MTCSATWPGLQQRYQLPQHNVRGLDHDLAYRGIESGTLQVTDLYVTDAEISYYKLRILEDDLSYFPAYNAVILYRTDLEQRAPEVVASFKRLAGRIDAPAMRKLNARVKLNGETEAAVAASFLEENLALKLDPQVKTAWQRFWQHTREHLVLVAISLSAAILVAIPLGIVAARYARVGPIVLGIGGPPAVVALFLYSLLPIIRNTHAGIRGISPAIDVFADTLIPTVD